MTPSPTNTTTTPAGTVITTTNPAHTPSTLNKIAAVLAALEPFILAGTAPFIKNEHSIQLVNTEAPLAQNLLNVLANL
ncbi:MAG: hypothetical protein KGI50_07115 [Patescibacteria group bacterium]|nr:hypothetical protein [Patescibacteria group bacterium]